MMMVMVMGMGVGVVVVMMPVRDDGAGVVVDMVVMMGIDGQRCGGVAEEVAAGGVADDPVRPAAAADVAVEADDGVRRRHDQVQVV